MTGEERRKKIIQIIEQSKTPVSGLSLAKQLQVSRQVIVQDVALLRANGIELLSTNRGYILQQPATRAQRVVKVIHTDEEVQEELQTIVDYGGKIDDVFVYHKVYGVIRAQMNLKSRMEIENYMQEINSGKSRLLKNVTSGYHYHTISADSEALLDIIQDKLQEKGFLAELQDYEPVDFWKKE